MEANEAAEQMREAIEEKREAAERSREGLEQRHEHDERSRNRAALTIAVLAMLLTITSVSASTASRDIVNFNIHASDTWAFYQAKNIRQTANQLAADQFQATLALNDAVLSPAARDALQKQIDKYKATIDRYDSDPKVGDGKKELSELAQSYEARRDRATEQVPNFELGTALLQIAIVLGSASIIVRKPLVLGASVALGAVAVLLLLNGYLLAVKLPF